MALPKVGVGHEQEHQFHVDDDDASRTPTEQSEHLRRLIEAEYAASSRSHGLFITRGREPARPGMRANGCVLGRDAGGTERSTALTSHPVIAALLAVAADEELRTYVDRAAVKSGSPIAVLRSPWQPDFTFRNLASHENYSLHHADNVREVADYVASFFASRIHTEHGSVVPVRPKASGEPDWAFVINNRVESHPELFRVQDVEDGFPRYEFRLPGTYLNGLDLLHRLSQGHVVMTAVTHASNMKDRARYLAQCPLVGSSGQAFLSWQGFDEGAKHPVEIRNRTQLWTAAETSRAWIDFIALLPDMNEYENMHGVLEAWTYMLDHPEEANARRPIRHELLLAANEFRHEHHREPRFLDMQHEYAFQTRLRHLDEEPKTPVDEWIRAGHVFPGALVRRAQVLPPSDSFSLLAAHALKATSASVAEDLDVIASWSRVTVRDGDGLYVYTEAGDPLEPPTEDDYELLKDAGIPLASMTGLSPADLHEVGARLSRGELSALTYH